MSQLHHPNTNSIPLLFVPTRKIQNIVLLEDSEGTWVLRIHLRLEAHKAFKPSKAILSYYTTLLSNFLGYVLKCLPPFVFVLQRQMKRIGEGNRFCHLTLSFTIDLLADKKFVFGSSEELNLSYNYEKESHSLHRGICLTCKLCKLEEQSLSVASSTENCFYLTLGKFLGN